MTSKQAADTIDSTLEEVYHEDAVSQVTEDIVSSSHGHCVLAVMIVQH